MTARRALYILDEIMAPVIAEPREELSKYAPKMLSIEDSDVDKIRDVIGTGGKVIQKICADCNVEDRHRGRRQRIHLRPSIIDGRRARHAHHQDHCRGPGDRRHL